MTGVFQRFEHGVMLFSQGVNGHNQRIYVLYDPGERPRSAAFETFDDR